MARTRSVSKKLALTGTDRDERAAMLRRIGELRKLQREFAPAIIACGVFNQNGLAESIAGAVAENATASSSALFRAWFNKLEAQFPGSTRLPSSVDNEKQEWASDLFYMYGYDSAAAGFLVGLAVGVQLGPHAFDVHGGAR